MKSTHKLAALFAGLVLASSCFSAGLASLSNKDATAGLKDALVQASSVAIGKLGVENGFLGNELVKIPLPDSLKRVEGALRMIGMQGQADELVVAMNRAAEQAVPEARTLLTGAIKNMSVSDAKGILTGGETAATDYFRRTTSGQLTQKFLPIVTRAVGRVGLAAQYNELAGRGAQLGLIDAKQAKIENYVTQKSLDGLFLMLAEQEKAIRRDPVGAATGMAQKIFDLLRK